MSGSNSNELDRAGREFLLALYRAAVNFYKPRIEKRTGVLLGDIAVWDHDRWHEDVMREYRRRASWPFVGIFKSFILRRRLRRYSPEFEAESARKAREHAARYYRSAIYVSFDSGMSHEDALASVVVHELAHALWERIAGKPLDERSNGAPHIDECDAEKYELFVEGFATYAERVWFLDLYPAALRSFAQRWPLKRESVYFRGLRRVEELVREHGQPVLLEIPKRWHDL